MIIMRSSDGLNQSKVETNFDSNDENQFNTIEKTYEKRDDCQWSA